MKCKSCSNNFSRVFHKEGTKYIILNEAYYCKNCETLKLPNIFKEKQ